MQDFKRFPVICSVGGINSAGRTSFDFSYKRLVMDNLDGPSKKSLLKDLNSLTNSEISSEKDITEKILFNFQRRKARVSRVEKRTESIINYQIDKILANEKLGLS